MLGISPDSVDSHRKFREKYELPYDLLADVGHQVAETYGVWKNKSMFGISFDGVARTTFLIDEAGRVARVFEKVNPLGHGAEVAEALEQLNSR